MKTSELSFDLPDRLIAQNPPPERGTARLMVVDRETGAFSHSSMVELAALLPKNAMLVFNDTRVRKSRLIGTTASGGRQELLLVRPLDEHRWEVLGKPARRIRPGAVFSFPAGTIGRVESSDQTQSVVRFTPPVDSAFLEEHGHVPLPPYIRRPDNRGDAVRYQTVFAEKPGSIAAPTAGLHFTNELLSAIKQRGIEVEFITLHVGIGTFLPVRSTDLRDHTMHSEEYSILPETADRLTRAHRSGVPIIAVGTTVVRTLESAFDRERDAVQDGSSATRLFIRPGYTFSLVDQMITNFHTPRSTLLAMVGAFAGFGLILRAYQEAIDREYRFFSYGDAMYIK